MIEIEDEHSESWAELTEFYYNDEENDKDIKDNKVKGKVYIEAAVFPAETERDEVHHERPDFSRSRRRGDYHGDNANGSWRRDRRRGGYHDNVPLRRDHSREPHDDSGPYSNRPGYTKRSPETSPFRSPLNRTTHLGSGDLDNSNNFRFTRPRRGDGRLNGSNGLNNNARSCRRLYSPAQCEDETDDRFQMVTGEPEGASTSEFENEHQSLTESTWIKQRGRDFDVRSQLNRNRRGDYHGDNGPWRRDRRSGGYHDNVPLRRDHSREPHDDNGPDSDRPGYTKRSPETSRFRSPLNSTEQLGSGDLDNSNHFSDVQMARREKDIAYGKNTDDYKTYLQLVPKHTRSKNKWVHPKTPDKFEKCSRKSWDGQVKVWKLNFHAWVANYQETSSRGDCSRKSSCSEGTTLTSEHTSVEEEDTDLALSDSSVEFSEDEDETKEVDRVVEEGFEVIADNIEYIDEEAEEITKEKVEKEDTNLSLSEDESKEKDDDTFLDALDYMLLVGNQGDS